MDPFRVSRFTFILSGASQQEFQWPLASKSLVFIPVVSFHSRLRVCTTKEPQYVSSGPSSSDTLNSLNVNFVQLAKDSQNDVTPVTLRPRGKWKYVPDETPPFGTYKTHNRHGNNATLDDWLVEVTITGWNTNQDHLEGDDNCCTVNLSTKRKFSGRHNLAWLRNQHWKFKLGNSKYSRIHAIIHITRLIVELSTRII